ncbi:hypothetical protein ARNL5_00446 [Anaerolineae bacterium]|nr:hypothetical protein ARNL5_00446 [Anaerolineae bacterium]
MEAGDAVDVNGMPARGVGWFDDTDRAFLAGDERYEEIGQTRRKFPLKEFPGQMLSGVESVVDACEVLRIAVIIGKEHEYAAIVPLR